METEDFCLRWNNHHTTFISVMNSLLQKELLVDVTLAAEGQFIEVHRLVLCACSQYFEDMLSHHKKKQSIVFLNNIRFADVRALVEYMYQGEVNVSQDQLPRFLAAAESLKIKGLADKANQQIIPPSLSEHITNQKPEANSVNSNKKRKISSSSRTYANNLRKPTPVRRQKTATSIPASSQMSTEVSEHEDNFISVSMKSEEDLPENVWIPKEETWVATNDVLCLTSMTEEPVDESHFNSQLSDPPVLLKNGSLLNGDVEKKKTKKSTSSSATARKKVKQKTTAVAAVASQALTQEGDMTCSRCWRQYTSRRAFLRHRTECGVEPKFACPYCPLRCKRQDYLKHHMRHVHANVQAAT